MIRFVANLSGLAQVTGMAYVAWYGVAPEWLRWMFGCYAGLWLILKAFDVPAGGSK